jgi:hypothetical protein
MADSLRPKRRNAVLELVGFLAGVPPVAPASAGRRLAPDKGKKVIAGDFQPFKILANYNEDMLADKWRIP